MKVTDKYKYYSVAKLNNIDHGNHLKTNKEQRKENINALSGYKIHEDATFPTSFVKKSKIPNGTKIS